MTASRRASAAIGPGHAFGASLRLLRVYAGLSLRSLAERVGVSAAYLSRVENGHDAPPTPDRLVEIARALGVAPVTLVELARQAGPMVAGYLERVPAAGALFLDLARRDLSPAQIARVRAFVHAEFPAGSGGARAAGRARDRAGPRLSAVVGPDRVVLDLTCADLEDALEVAAVRCAEPADGRGPSARTVAQGFAAREREGSTLLGAGVAAPHALFPGIETRAAVVTLARAVAADGTPDGRPVRVLVALALRAGDRRHPELLAQVARLANHDLAGDLCRARDEADLLRRLEELEAVCG